MTSMTPECVALAERILAALKFRNLTRFEFCSLAKRSSDYGIWVERISKTSFKVVFTGMYSSDFETYDEKRPFDFETLEILSEIFQTKNINIGSVEGYNSGCETCGYGGRYGIDIFVHDVE